MKIVAFVGILLGVQVVFAQMQGIYKTPPVEIIKLLEAKASPDILLDPTGEWLLQKVNRGFPSIAEISKPEIRIAGITFYESTNCMSRISFIDSLVLTNLQTGKDYEVSGLPENAKLANFEWAPNGKYIDFTHNSTDGVELWVLHVEKKHVYKLTETYVNAVMPVTPAIWIDGGEWLAFTSVLKDRGRKPEKPIVPNGPNIKQSQRGESAARHYHDLLLNENDEELFEYYATSQLIKINVNKEEYSVGIPAIFKEFSPSPDFRFLMVKMIHKPFSYIVPYNCFPYKVEIWDNDGNLFRELFELPLAESIPKGFGAVPKGPREVGWRCDKPASLYWVKALDGGDPNREMVTRDRLFLFDFPFDGDGYESIAFKDRFCSVQWNNSNVAICTEKSWKKNTETVSSFSPDEPKGGNKKMLFEYNLQDEYNHPGVFITKKNESGFSVLQFLEKESILYLKGEGASKDGSKPFLDSYDLLSGEKKRLWQSSNPYYEYPVSFIDVQKDLILTRSETRTDPPNYFSRNLKNGVVSQITNHQNPYPQLGKMDMKWLKYSRNDGVQLTGTLYTPPGFGVGDAMLPVLIWLQPSEFEVNATVSRIINSPNRFVSINWASPIFLVMRGYAVLDNPAMPIFVSNENDSDTAYIAQLVANANAAVHCLDSLGIVDKNKIAIGGNGYGAFMAANLLAHTNLFTAGIARSGAYNLTLTPFGFESEQRTIWEAKDAYIYNSSFLFADKIKAPLLLIHGNADNNSETYPMQSEIMFTALKANGTNVRLVILPNESHNYTAKESIYHMLWEMDTWLELYLKHK